jgi:molecular chaperone GrpE
MPNKRHPHSPRVPSLDPDTKEPVVAETPVEAAQPPSAPSPGAASPHAPAAPSTPTAAEVDVWKDRHLRLAAEYDNFRKRTTKERIEAWQRAQAELIARLADALDDLSRFARIDPAETDAKRLHEAVELVERKIWKELESAGVTRVDQVGVPFDPNVHEAVTMQPAPKPELDHTVGQVVQPGYKMRDTLLRPARVIVLTWHGGGH